MKLYMLVTAAVLLAQYMYVTRVHINTIKACTHTNTYIYMYI